MLTEIFTETIIDCLKQLPFLFAAYLVIELLENYSGEITGKVLEKFGKAGPVIGALCGCVPQCGFSVLAANLFAGGLVSPGTLVAVFLATSDEAVIILLGNPGYLKEISALIAAKIIIAVICGYITDIFLARFISEPRKERELCEHCGCHDEEGHHHILIPALKHTGMIIAYIFIFTLALNCVTGVIGEERFSELLLGNTVFQPLISAVIGFIPNCAASVILTQLYIAGVLSFPAVISGLCTGAGAGLLVLLRVNRHRKETAKIIALMYVYAAAAGVILYLVMK